MIGKDPIRRCEFVGEAKSHSRSPLSRLARILVSVGALVLGTNVAGAQAKEPFEIQVPIYAGGGLSMPLGPSDFRDGWEQGWSAGGGIGYRLSPRSEIRTLMYHNQFELNPMDVPGVSGGDYTVLEVSVDYKLYLTGLRADDRLGVYVVGGLGFGGVTLASVTFPHPLGTTRDFNETRHTFDLGGGVDFRATPRTAIFAEVKLILIRADEDDTTYLPLRAGVRFLLAH